jgi:hypothetical protein
MDEELYNTQIRVERKFFYFTLRQNPRGRFVKITEDVNGRRDSIIMPATGLVQFRDALNELIDSDEKAGPAPVAED